jgi:argininosuccinate lyase
MPFRQAHHVTGTLVKVASDRGVALEALTLADFQAVEPRITDGVYSVLGVDQSVASRTSYGGTAPANVEAQAKRWLARLAEDRGA